MGIDVAEENLPTPSVEQVLGIDLGGSAIKLGRFSHEGNCLQAVTVPTPQPATPDAVLVAIVEAIAHVDPERQADAIGATIHTSLVGLIGITL